MVSELFFPPTMPRQKDMIFSSTASRTNGKDLQQITTESQFNAFPMFSPDGKKIVWSSNQK
jgi:hypothetical protein